MSIGAWDKNAKQPETAGWRSAPGDLLTVGIGRAASTAWINEFKHLFARATPDGTELQPSQDHGVVYVEGRKLVVLGWDRGVTGSGAANAGARLQRYLNEHKLRLPETIDDMLQVSLSGITALDAEHGGFDIRASVLDIPSSGMTGGYCITNELVAVRALTGVRATEPSQEGRPEYGLAIGTVNRGSQQRLDEILATVEEQISHNVGLEPLDYVRP